MAGLAAQRAAVAAARNILRLLERLDLVRTLGPGPARAGTIPSAPIDRLADEAVRITPQHLGELGPCAVMRH